MTADRRACHETCEPNRGQHHTDCPNYCRAALVERALEAFITGGGMELSDANRLAKWPPLFDGMSAAISLIRAEVLEEAAKVADHHAETTEWTDGHLEAVAIAAAIRALKDKP